MTTIIWYPEGYFVALFKVVYILDTREHINIHIFIEIDLKDEENKKPHTAMFTGKYLMRFEEKYFRLCQICLGGKWYPQ